MCTMCDIVILTHVTPNSQSLTSNSFQQLLSLNLSPVASLLILQVFIFWNACTPWQGQTKRAVVLQGEEEVPLGKFTAPKGTCIPKNPFHMTKFLLDFCLLSPPKSSLWCQFYCVNKSIHTFLLLLFFSEAQQPNLDLGYLIVQVPRSHTQMYTDAHTEGKTPLKE